MGARSEELANQYDQAVHVFAQAVERCSDAQWQATCGDEGWTVAATAQHVAGQFPLEMEYITAAAEGRALPSYSWDDINGKNDGRAAAHTTCTRQDVLDLLHQHAPGVSAYVRALSDEQLDRQAPLALADGAMVSTQQLIEGGVLIAHVNGHLASIEAAGEPAASEARRADK
jgi:hypothetical protein